MVSTPIDTLGGVGPNIQVISVCLLFTVCLYNKLTKPELYITVHQNIQQ